MKENQDIEITKTWISGKTSCTVVIPKRFAVYLGFSASTPVILELRADGLLIRRLVVS
jgi:hypothetical protein